MKNLEEANYALTMAKKDIIRKKAIINKFKKTIENQ